MGTLFVDKLDPQSGTSLEIGSSGDTVAVNTGATTNLAGNVTLGASGKTITVPAGATITNSGTATGFGVGGTESFKVVLGTDQTVTSGVYTLVNYDTEIVDNGSNYDTSNKKYTAPATGTYQFNIIMSFATDSSYGLDNIAIQLYKNGSAISGQFSLFNAPSHTGSGSFDSGSIGCPVLINLSANDYIQVYARAIKNSNATSCSFYSDNDRRSEWSGFRVS